TRRGGHSPPPRGPLEKQGDHQPPQSDRKDRKTSHDEHHAKVKGEKSSRGNVDVSPQGRCLIPSPFWIRSSLIFLRLTSALSLPGLAWQIRILRSAVLS